MQKYVRYVIIASIFLNLPSFVLLKINAPLASILSIATYILLIYHYIDVKNRHQPNMWLFFLFITFFSISALINPEYTPTPRFFLTEFVKVLILIICGEEVIRRFSTKELYYVLGIGALSVLLHVFLFFDPLKDSGRFSGFYLDPNAAGFICVIGYSLSFAFKGRIKLVGQIIFTLMGLLTLSRTFLIIWILSNLISIRIDLKNAKLLGYGFLLIILLVSFNEVLPVQNVRLKQLSSFVKGENIDTAEVNEDSRSDTWAVYYEYIIDKPFFGNGFNTFGSRLGEEKGNISVGVHNTYLKILGESGFFVFLIFLFFIVKLLIDSFKVFRVKPYLFLMAINLAIFLLTVHNFFDNSHRIMITLWIYFKIHQSIKETETSFLEHYNK